MSVSLVHSQTLKQDTSGLVSAEEAFKIDVSFDDNDATIHAAWEIADGYYLYKNQIRFQLAETFVEPQNIALPEGVQKDDPLFGLVETYFDDTEAVASLQSFAQTLPDNAQLTVHYQGCYEPLGICYPPQKSVMDIPAAFLAALNPVQNSMADDLQEPLTAPQQEPLISAQQEPALFDPAAITSKVPGILEQEAQQNTFANEFSETPEFTYAAYATGTHSIDINFNIPRDYYLYKDQFNFVSLSPEVAVKSIEYSPGRRYDDPEFGEVEVFFEQATISIELYRYTTLKQWPFEVRYQGCKVNSVCLPPAVEKSQVSLSDIDETQLSKPDDGTASNVQAENGQSVSEPLESQLPAAKKAVGLPWLLLSAFAAGLLLTFTPCVLPMIPILAGILQRNPASKMHHGLIAIFYVLGTATTYALIGAVAGASGHQLQAYFQSTWVLIAFALLLLLMAMSMFGMFRVQLPTALQSKLASLGPNKTGGLISAYFMGLVSALIVGACVSPVLISTVTLVIQQGNALKGALTLFVMALGMGVILVAFAFGAQSVLPKSGNWMKVTNHLIGFLLIGVGIYLLSTVKIVPVMWLFTFYLLAISAYLVVTFLMPDKARAEESGPALKVISGALAAMLFIWAAIAMVGAFTGSRDLFQPLDNFAGSLTAQNVNSNQTQLSSDNNSTPGNINTLFQKVNSVEALDNLLRNNNKSYVMIDYYADWCKDCLRMEKTTFTDARVLSKLDESFLVIKIDVTDAYSDETNALKQRFQVYGPPATLFLDAGNNLLNDFSFYGYRNADEFAILLDEITQKQ